MYSYTYPFGSADELVQLLSVLEHLEGRHGRDAAGGSDRLDLIDVDLEEHDGSEFVRELDKLRSDHAAGPAPGRREVNDDLQTKKGRGSEGGGAGASRLARSFARSLVYVQPSRGLSSFERPTRPGS